MSERAPNKWLITLAVMVPTLIEILDTSIANVALGHIQGSLSAGQDEVTWVLTSYLVYLASFLLFSPLTAFCTIFLESSPGVLCLCSTRSPFVRLP